MYAGSFVRMCKLLPCYNHCMSSMEDMEKLQELELGKNPGLGIVKLHEKGITGRGVPVAIIDQKLRLTHVEYKDSIARYTEVDDLSGEAVSMHGSGVCSFLCGKSCGVAPEASLHYYATKSGRSFEDLSKALYLIIDFNKSVDPSSRIRIVSMSIGFMDNKDEPGLSDFKKSLDTALEANVYPFVINKKYLNNDIIAGGSKDDKDDPKSYEPAIFLAPHLKEIRKGAIIVPADYRSRADYKDDTSYVYDEKGGMSWVIPYLAGVAALALQKKPNLKFQEFNEFVSKTASEVNNQLRVINPRGIIERL